MATEVLERFENKVHSLTLRPGLGGVFEIRLGDRKVFSKKDAGDFPEPGAVVRLLEEALSQVSPGTP